ALVAPRGDARADRPGRDRRRHDRAPPGRAGRGRRLPGSAVRAAGVAHRPAGRRCRAAGGRRDAAATGATTFDRCRRRPALLPGLRRFAGAGRCHRYPGGGDAGGQGRPPFDHPSALGALGATGTLGANLAAREADVVLAVGTRLSDFTTASHTAFQDPGLRLIALNVSGFDAHKLAALPLVADARAGLEQLAAALTGYRVDAVHADLAARRNREWDAEVERLTAAAAGPPDVVVVCAAGSLPGDLHKLWRARDPDGYHLEYGYSCMGYEVAGGLGVKMADPDREVYVLVGDGSYLMMSQEIATAIQEGVKINIILLDNHGFSSIGGLSRACGSGGFGTEYRYRTDGLKGKIQAIDFVANAASLGARAERATTREELAQSIASCTQANGVSVIVVETDYHD